MEPKFAYFPDTVCCSAILLQLHLANKSHHISSSDFVLHFTVLKFAISQSEAMHILLLSILTENMVGYLSTDIICTEKWKVFQEHSLRKTVSFEEQIMPKEKYLSIFSKSNRGYLKYCVNYPSNIFFPTHAVLKIGEYPQIFPSFSWGIFSHVTPFDQLHVSESIWWIITCDIRSITWYGYDIMFTWPNLGR